MVVIRRKSETPPEQASPAPPREQTEHAKLVERTRRWLVGSCGCGFALTELVAATPTGEVPDAIGFRDDFSVLVECKATRADFLADRKKSIRASPARGMGTFRLFLCPPGVIAPEDLPDRWGLLYAQGARVRKVVAPEGNIWSLQQHFMFERNKDAELALLASALRRVYRKGREDVFVA